jgi:hypothetical protein
VTLAHIGFSLEFRHFKLDLVQFVSDVIACESIELDFQAVEFQQNAS